VTHRWLARTAIAGLAILLGCGSETEPPPAGNPRVEPSSALPDGVVARVGSLQITKESAAKLATTRQIDVRAAVELAVHEALLANAAEVAGLRDEPTTRAATRGALVHALVADLRDAATRAGAVTDAELAEVTARHWLELERPEGYRAVHAVVRLRADASADTKRQAEDVAAAIRAAVEPAAELARSTSAPAAGDGDPASALFKSAAELVPHAGLELVVQDLDPVASDGRVLTVDGRTYERDFLEALMRLNERGECSPPSSTRFGLHVILLLERTPPNVVPLEERRKLVRDEVVSTRAQRAYRSLLDGLRSDAHLVLGADALLATLPEAP
jgi:peptidyl-prolyl cis-trans isomerase C